ncbi:hypothetical protein, partial [Treponema sp. R80B11-R83G3]
YAIPASAAQTFINNATNQKPETFKAALDKRLENFLKGLGENKAVYPHIAEYLSSICVGENAEYAVSEMYDKGNSTVRRAFIEKCEDSVVGAMGYAVAWTIENSLRGGQVTIKAAIKEVTGSGEEYTVVFTINNKDVRSIWVREYGNWRIKSFGSVAAGDKSLMSKKEADKKAKENLRINSALHLEAGYANLFERASTAFYFSLDFLGVLGFNLYYTDPDLWCIGMLLGYHWGIPAGNFGFMPYFRIGTNFMTDSGFENHKEGIADGFPVAFTGQVGLKITTSFVPGLFVGTAFQLNIFSLTDYDKLMK